MEARYERWRYPIPVLIVNWWAYNELPNNSYIMRNSEQPHLLTVIVEEDRINTPFSSPAAFVRQYIHNRLLQFVLRVCPISLSTLEYLSFFKFGNLNFGKIAKLWVSTKNHPILSSYFSWWDEWYKFCHALWSLDGAGWDRWFWGQYGLFRK